MTGAGPRTAPARAALRGQRLFWLDNLRVGLIALVLVHHSAITYSHVPLWTYTEQPHDDSALLLDALLPADQMWFMGLFFLISGYFVPSSVDRHGVAGFVWGRLIRLGVPIVLFIVVLRPLFVLPAWLAVPDRGAFLPAFLATIDPGPMWFVLVLLVFSLGYAALRAMADDRGPRPRSAAVGLRAVVVFGLGLGVVTYLWRILVPDGSYWPVVGLPTPSYLPQYVLCFVVGCMAARRGWLESISSRVALVSAAVAVPSFVAYLELIGVHGANGGPRPVALAAAVALSLGALSTMTVVLAIFRRFATGTGPIRKWLSDNAFAVYFVHAPVLALLGMAMAGRSAPAAVKALGLFIVGAVASWLLAAAIRRIPGARRVF